MLVHRYHYLTKFEDNFHVKEPDFTLSGLLRHKQGEFTFQQRLALNFDTNTFVTDARFLGTIFRSCRVSAVN